MSLRGSKGHSGLLNGPHERMLLEESGISPEVAAERGYYTARRGGEVPEVFSKGQRRPGLVVPMFSPDGVTRGWQIRPDKPRKKGLKYESPSGGSLVVDVHPRMIEEVRHGEDSLLITEGGKTGDAATSRGIPTLVLAGTDGWNVPKAKPKRLRPCFDHVRLKGRAVYVCFDSDCMTKESVQRALEELVAALEERGATVWVIYLPDAPDGKKLGIDDYLAGGHGTITEMFALARKFEPQDLGRIRLSRDEKLRALVENLSRTWRETRWTWPGAASDAAVYLKLLEASRRHGRAVEGGIRVVKAQGPLALEARISSRTVWKALNRLEERGLLRRDNEGRQDGETGAFVLRAGVSRYGGGRCEEGAEVSGRGRVRVDLHLRAPRLWPSRPKWKPTKKMIMEYRVRGLSYLPEPREGLERLGKKREHCFDRLDDAGGSLSLEELGEQTGVRPRDLIRRKDPDSEKGRDGLLIWPEKAGIVAVYGGTVSLTPDWQERLRKQRELGEEIEASEVARRRCRERSQAYRNRHKGPESRPSAASLEAMRRSHAMRDARLRELARAEEERRKAGPPPGLEVLISGLVRMNGRLRMGLLCELANDEGFDRRDVPDAVRAMGYRVERLPEYGDEGFVFPPTEGAA